MQQRELKKQFRDYKNTTSQQNDLVVFLYPNLISAIQHHSDMVLLLCKKLVGG